MRILRVYHPEATCPLCAWRKPIERLRAAQAVRQGLAADWRGSVLEQCPRCRKPYVLTDALHFRTVVLHNCPKEA